DDAPATPTLAQYLDQHIEESTSASSATKGNYRRYVATRRDGIGALQLDEVTKADVRRWVKGLQSAGKTGKTVKNHL
ncbi:site-specific integrase, partial [Mycobacterium kansasii]